MIRDKYKLLITGHDAQTYRPGWIKSVIEDWVRDSGARKVMSGVVHADVDQKADKITYSACFDSYWWTGRGEPLLKNPKIEP